MKNIIFFFCDELRPDALSCYQKNKSFIHTPAIDSIAENGLLFENCFCNSPLCVPSRTSLMTGLYPEDTGVYGNEAALSSFVMPRSVTTFPEVLHRAGYHTASFGKTHLPPELHPFETDDSSGSEMNLGLTQQELKALKKIGPKGSLSFNAGSIYPKGRKYGPEQVTSHALQWISKQQCPYFVRISYTQPHSPIILKQGFEKMYDYRLFDGKLPDLSRLSQFEQAFARIVAMDTMTEKEIQMAKAYYYAMVCWIDSEVKKVLDFLKTQGTLENTILILGADHGALRGECAGLGKHIFNRASQAVPLIIKAPGLNPGDRIPTLCSNIDIPKTIFDLVGIQAPRQFKGQSLLQTKSKPAINPDFTFDRQNTGEVYATIGFGEADSYAFPARQLGRFPGNHGWPRRSCIRQLSFRLDMNTRIDGHTPLPEQQDIFFTDCLKYPDENCNLVNDPAYASVIKQLYNKLQAHCQNAAEATLKHVRFSREMVLNTKQ